MYLWLLTSKLTSLVCQYLLHEEIFNRYTQFAHFHVCYELSLRDNPKSIANRFNIRKYMSIEEDCFSFFFEFKHEIFHHLATDRIESTHRLIEKYHIRIVQDRLSQSDTLEHTFRIGIESLRSGIRESYFSENKVFSLSKMCRREVVECSIEIEEFITCEVLIEIGILWHETDLPTYILIVDTSPKQDDLSESRSHNPEDTLHRRSLPCTIGSEKSEYLALRKRERNIVKECRLSDFFREMFDRYERCIGVFFHNNIRKD